jgi:hypothetical protein
VPTRKLHRTLSLRGESAHWTGEAGDPAGARDQYAALQPIFERALGLINPTRSESGRTSVTGPADADDHAGAAGSSYPLFNTGVTCKGRRLELPYAYAAIPIRPAGRKAALGRKRAATGPASVGTPTPP